MTLIKFENGSGFFVSNCSDEAGDAACPIGWRPGVVCKEDSIIEYEIQLFSPSAQMPILA